MFFNVVAQTATVVAEADRGSVLIRSQFDRNVAVFFDAAERVGQQVHHDLFNLLFFNHRIDNTARLEGDVSTAELAERLDDLDDGFDKLVEWLGSFLGVAQASEI